MKEMLICKRPQVVECERFVRRGVIRHTNRLLLFEALYKSMDMQIMTPSVFSRICAHTYSIVNNELHVVRDR